MTPLEKYLEKRRATFAVVGHEDDYLPHRNVTEMLDRTKDFFLTIIECGTHLDTDLNDDMGCHDPSVVRTDCPVCLAEQGLCELSDLAQEILDYGEGKGQDEQLSD